MLTVCFCCCFFNFILPDKFNETAVSCARQPWLPDKHKKKKENETVPCGLCEFAVDLLIHIYIEGPLDEGQGHLQGLSTELGAVLSYELQPLNAHQPTVAGRILLQVLQTHNAQR